MCGCQTATAPHSAVQFSQGTLLGSIYNLYGDVVAELKAPKDGLVFGLRSRPSVLEGQWCCFFGVVEKTVDNLLQGG